MVIEVKQDGKFVKIPFISTNYPVGEAPEDGKQYARKDGDWSEVIIPEVDLTEIETAIVDNATDIAANTAAIAANTTAIDTKVDKVSGKQLSTEDYTTADKTKVANLPTPDSIVVTTDPRLTAATTTKAGLMSAADKVQLDSTLTATEIENKVNAAVSSVYRVKGTVASVSNLPTSDVAIGDVWNIADNGANYVATNNNPVEWDKLSETVDLTPYILTSTANNTFVKKAGDTMTGELIVNRNYFPYFTAAKAGTDVKLSMGVGDNGECILRRSVTDSTSNADLTFTQNELKFKNIKVATVDGTDKINVRNPLVSNQHCSLNNNGLDVFSPATSANGGISYLNSAGNSFIGFIGARITGDTLNRLFLGWGKDPANMSNQFYVNENDIKYKNIDVALTNGNKGIRVSNSNNTASSTHTDDGFLFKPSNVTTFMGLRWYKQDGSTYLGAFTARTEGDNESLFRYSMGWGPDHINPLNSLIVSSTEFKYKNIDVALTDDSKTITIHRNPNSSNKAMLFGAGMNIIPLSTTNATGINWRKLDDSDNNFSIGAVTVGDDIETGFLYMGWKNGENDPYNSNYNFAVGKNRFTYKNNKVWHAGNQPQSVVLTQTEYNALGSTVNSDGKIYFIKE